jgi:hypothetical protein
LKGKYIYCVIPSGEKRDFGLSSIGDGKEKIETIPYKELGAVTSELAEEALSPTRENSLAHEEVLLRVMKDYSPLPFEFGTIAPSEKAVSEMLAKNYPVFERALRNIKGKIEIDVRAFWRDMKTIFKEIVDEHWAIARFKKEIQARPFSETQADRVRIGMMVARALEVKKKREGERIFGDLKKFTQESKALPIVGDPVITNIAFLLKREKKEEFDKRLDEIASHYEGRVDFRYAGPLPCYNFVDIRIRM